VDLFTINRSRVWISRPPALLKLLKLRVKAERKAAARAAKKKRKNAEKSRCCFFEKPTARARAKAKGAPSAQPQEP
jgi:hypothetical protein